MIEFSHLLDVIPILLALYGIFLAWQVRRAGTDEGLRQKQEELSQKQMDDVAALYKRVDEVAAILQQKIEVEGSILRGKHEIADLKMASWEVYLKPYFTTADKRMADLFHQPHQSAWRLDRLIEEYRRDTDEMSAERLQEIIDEMWVIHRQASKEGDDPNPFVFFASNDWLSVLDGRRDRQLFWRTHEPRLRELEAQQVMLEEASQALRVDTPLVGSVPERTRTSWWRRWYTWVQNSLGRSR